MRWALALGWLAMVADVRADVPMDLDSPFLKTALIRSGGGQTEEREVRGGRLQGDKIEFLYPSGSPGIFPRGDVLAVLPRLPSEGIDYGVADLEAAVRFLEGLPPEFRGRPEASAEVLQRWNDLKKPAQEKAERKQQEALRSEEQKKKSQADEVAAWRREVMKLGASRSEAELQQLRSQGEGFLQAATPDPEKVQDGLALLAQIQGKEKGSPLPRLAKLQEIQPSLVAGEELGWWAGGILGLSLFGLLMGLSFSTSGLTRLREGFWLGGVVYGGMGLAILSLLSLFWWPRHGTGAVISRDVAVSTQWVLTAAKNHVQPTYFFPEMDFTISGPDFASGILGSLSPSSEGAGLFRTKLKESTLWVTPNGWFWRQPVTVFGLPLPVTFGLTGPVPPAAGWLEPNVEQVYLGRVKLPAMLGSLVADAMKSTLRAGLQQGGFDKIQLQAADGDTLRAVVPASGTRPPVKVKATASLSGYRRDIRAEDLAEIFAAGRGEEFFEKFVLVDGVVEKVVSGSEYLGGKGPDMASTDSGKVLKVASDRFDVFYLRGAKSYGHRSDPLYIRCVIKSPHVFSMDSYGDIYYGPRASNITDRPLIKKGYRVQFNKEGRVQSREIKNNEIEVYGIELFSESDLSVYDPGNPSPPLG